MVSSVPTSTTVASTEPTSGLETITPAKVDVGGVFKYKGMSGANTSMPGYEVASPEDVFGPNNTGKATQPFTPGTVLDEATNTWVKPIPQPTVAPQAPIVPIVTPAIVPNKPITPAAPVIPAQQTQPPATPTTPGTTPGGGVITKPTSTETKQPITPIVTPPVVTPPAPVVPPTNVTPAPVAPQPTTSQPTIVFKDGTVHQTITIGGELYDKDTGRPVKTYDPTQYTISGGGTSGAGAEKTPTAPTPTVSTPSAPKPLSPIENIQIPPSQPIPNVTPETPVTPPTTPTVPPVTPPIVPIDVPLEPKTPTDTTHYGTYTIGKPIVPNIPTGLNPGWMAPTPFYTNVTPSQSQYYWGSHPYQPGPTFNAQLYNTVPAAPTTPWGAANAQTSATPQQILEAMGYYYPLTPTVTGAVKP